MLMFVGRMSICGRRSTLGRWLLVLNDFRIVREIKSHSADRSLEFEKLLWCDVLFELMCSPRDQIAAYLSIRYKC